MRLFRALRKSTCVKRPALLWASVGKNGQHKLGQEIEPGFSQLNVQPNQKSQMSRPHPESVRLGRDLKNLHFPMSSQVMLMLLGQDH